jgi:hypothetical protein
MVGAAQLQGLACTGADVRGSVFGIFRQRHRGIRAGRERVRSGVAAARARGVPWRAIARQLV